MEITLPPDLERFVEGLVEEEAYGAPQHAVEAGLRLLMAQEAFRKSETARVRALVQEGIDDLDAGRSRDGEEVMQELRRRFVRLTEERDEAA